MNKKIQNFFDFFRTLCKKEKPISFFDYLDSKTVVFLNVSTREEALKELIEVSNRADKLKDKEEFQEAIFKRERILSTGIGLGIAVPHTRLASYKDFFIVIGIQKGKGIEWNALDNLSVNLIFMIGGPDGNQTEYLKILAHLTWVLKNPEKRKALLEATSEDEVVNLFRE